MRYAISDIHGCPKTFKHALTSIGFNKEDELFLLGDYIDRGPDSLGVLEHIWRLEADGCNVICLRGNHEQMLIDHMAGRQKLYEWEAPTPELKRKVLEWMKELKYYQLTPGYILTHAGLNFRHPNPLEDLNAMLWIRKFYKDVDLSWLGERVLVHGHTPDDFFGIKFGIARMGIRGYACIDSGCAHRESGMGFLTVLNLDSREGRYFRRVD